MEEVNFKTFAESFFLQLGAKVQWNNDVLTITNVPQGFEEFYGKKAPYRLVFSTSSDPMAELVARGSFILKAMTSYLDQRGQTALIKLDFDRDYKEEFTRYFKFKNSNLLQITSRETYDSLVRFTFGTTLQYLNEKETVTNSIFVKNNLVVPFVLEKYNQKEGKSDEFSVQDIKPAYEVAKSSLKSLIEPRLKESQALLKVKLERELARIQQHYTHQRQEREVHLQKLRDQLAQLEKQSSDLVAAKKQRVAESIRDYENSSIHEKFSKEEAFFIQDETHKHALNVHNKLINTSLIYYPIFTFTFFLKNADVTRQVALTYNPLDDSLVQPIRCEGCKSEIREILICSSSHIVCANCYDQCRQCERGICKNCTIRTCDVCMRKLCKRCAVKCTLCWKDVCKTHSHINYVNGKIGCSNCLQRCAVCGTYADKKHSKNTQRGNTCDKCARLSAVKFDR